MKRKKMNTKSVEKLVLKYPNTDIVYGECRTVEDALDFLNNIRSSKIEETASWCIHNGKIEQWLEKIGKGKINEKLQLFRSNRAEYARVFRILNDYYYEKKPQINLAGYEKERKEIHDLCISTHKNSHITQKYGLRKGGAVLLYGPPGCGKTAIAKSVAKNSGKIFIQVPADDFVNGRVSVFETAKRLGNVVIFIDEIEPATAHRAIFSGTKPSQLLDLVGDELFDRGVVLIGATNLPWVLEPALLRSGRMDKLVYVGVPDEVNRRALFRLFTKDLMFEEFEDADIEDFVYKSKFFSCSDIREVCSRACYNAWAEAIRMKNSRKVTKKEILGALDGYNSTATLWFRDAINTCLDVERDKRFRPMVEQMELYKGYNGDMRMTM